MFQILWSENVCSMGMFCFFAASIGVLIFLAVKYNRFIKEAENMSITKRKELKAIKTKFLNSYGKKETKDEDYFIQEQINVEVFVDKAVNRLKLCGQKPHIWKFISVQFLLISIVFAGIGSFRGIIAQMSFREISPFYLIAFLELYVYFSVVSICDFEGKDKLLRLTIIEYIENHMVNRIRIAKAFQAEEKVIQILEEEQKKQNMFSKEKEQELEDLLQEFLV
ncbi:MAG: hypothetical protein J6J73_01410 [Agathobacter sp.]|nr:hypothetical protein [Agathobacter sp.]